MSHFRYNLDGRWWKGNTHIHSTVSDGGKNFHELAGMYAGVGYDFLFRADHWIASSVRADTESYPLVWLDGIELDGSDGTGAEYHVVMLGSFEGIEREMGLEQAMAAGRAQGGILILAHPAWMGNTFADALRWGFDGVEVYNHVCHWMNGKSDGGAYWNAMLSENPNTLGFAADDAHIIPGHPGWNGGWVMVNAPECTPAAITAAIKAGNYYSSCGPAFTSIEFDGKQVSFNSSPVRFARMVGPKWCGQRTGSFDGSSLTEGAFEIPDDWEYAYLEIEDDYGRRAWTNSLFVSE